MKLHIILVIGIIGLFISGCSVVPKIFGKSSAAITKQETKLDVINTKLANNDREKLKDIAVTATGTDHALNVITNPPMAVTVAMELNKRVISEAGYQPTVDQLKTIYKLVDDLITNNAAGLKELAAKDKIIQSLHDNEELLNKEKQIEFTKYIKLANEAASRADTTQDQLNKYQSYWGLGAIAIGLKSFVTHVLWWGLGFIVLFIALRILSAMNPVAAAIFGIFEQVGAAFINCIAAMVPRAMSTVQSVESSLAVKLVDSIAYAKSTGQDISAVTAQLSNVLTDIEKAKVTKIKSDLNYTNNTSTPSPIIPTT